MIRILIADHHEVVRSGLRGIVECHPRWAVVGEAADGAEAITKAVQTKPDIVIIDATLPLVDAVEVTREIRRRLRKTEVLVLAIQESESLVHKFLKAGARGYLLKSDGTRYLLEAIETLTTHRPFFTANVSRTLLECFLSKPSPKAQTNLTTRERQVVELITEGHTNRQIAGLLSLSLKTVEAHRFATMRKLNLSSSADLVRYAIRNKIVLTP